MPLSCPIKKAFLRLNPSLLKGTLTAKPSGKFWMPIPKAKRQAATKVAPSKLYAIEPKATPTAKPSGILCSV